MKCVKVTETDEYTGLNYINQFISQVASCLTLFYFDFKLSYSIKILNPGKFQVKTE